MPKTKKNRDVLKKKGTQKKKKSTKGKITLYCFFCRKPVTAQNKKSAFSSTCPSCHRKTHWTETHDSNDNEDYFCKDKKSKKKKGSKEQWQQLQQEEEDTNPSNPSLKDIPTDCHGCGLSLWEDGEGIEFNASPSGLNRKTVDKGRRELNEDNPSTLKQSQITQLMEMALENCIFFKDQYNTGFAGNKQDNGSLAIYPIRSRAFKNFLSLLMFNSTGAAVGTEIINACINTLEAKAIFEGEKYPLYNRVGQRDDDFYYDIGDDDWNIIKISHQGWSVMRHNVPLFRRYTHQKNQIMPNSEKPGDYLLLKKFVNLKNQKDMILVIVTVATYLIPGIPHAIIDFFGEQGSTKTTLMIMLLLLADPSSLETLHLPRDSDQLIQMLQHHWVCPFDNASVLTPQQSDSLCRAVTGEGHSKRALYTNDDDVIYHYKRCIILTGINNPIIRPDLLDRSVLIEIASPSDGLKPEKEVWSEFHSDLPAIFTGLLNAIVTAMKSYSDIEREFDGVELPRLADYCIWGEAIARALGYVPMEFYNAYTSHIREKDREAVEQNVIGTIVFSLMEECNDWKDTPSATYEKFCCIADVLSINANGKYFPKAPNALSRRLNEIRPNLKRMAILVDTGGHDEKGRRYIHIRKNKKAGNEDNADTVKTEKPSNNRCDHVDDDLDGIDDPDLSGQIAVRASIPDNLRFDGIDDIIPILRGALGFDNNQITYVTKIINAMRKEPYIEWSIDRLADAIGIPLGQIKDLLMRLTSNPNNPTPIRIKDKRRDYYFFDALELDKLRYNGGEGNDYDGHKVT